MNEHIHPVFRNVLNNLFAAASSPKDYYLPGPDDRQRYQAEIDQGQEADQQQADQQQANQQEPPR